MNIFKVIGWTDYSDEKYTSIDGSVAANQAVITELREKGYRFGGDAHQERRGCCPVLNNGAKVCYSMRGWGAIMAEALGINTDKYAYMEWYMDGWTRVGIVGYEGIERKSVYPHPGVDETRISPALCGKTIHTMHLAKAPFDSIARGEKTVEVRLNDEKRQAVKAEDIIVFNSFDDARDIVVAQVVRLYHFNRFQELFASELFPKTGSADISAEEAVKSMYQYYTKEQEELYGVLGIEVKLLTE